MLASLPRDHICDLLEKFPHIRNVLDKEAIEVGIQIHPNLYQCLKKSLHDNEFLRKLPCEAFIPAANNISFLHQLDQDVLVSITGLTNISHIGRQVLILIVL